MSTDNVMYQMRASQIDDITTMLHKIDKDQALTNQTLDNVVKRIEGIECKQDHIETKQGKHAKYITIAFGALFLVIVGSNNPELLKVMMALI